MYHVKDLKLQKNKKMCPRFLGDYDLPRQRFDVVTESFYQISDDYRNFIELQQVSGTVYFPQSIDGRSIETSHSFVTGMCFELEGILRAFAQAYILLLQKFDAVQQSNFADIHQQVYADLCKDLQRQKINFSEADSVIKYIKCRVKRAESMAKQVK